MSIPALKFQDLLNSPILAVAEVMNREIKKLSNNEPKWLIELTLKLMVK